MYGGITSKKIEKHSTITGLKAKTWAGFSSWVAAGAGELKTGHGYNI
jgi:hypothetical protein